MGVYEKPILLEQEDATEGIYLASGEAGGAPQCKSIYRNGVFKPVNWTGTTNDDLGCQGCPASELGNGTSCRIDLAVYPELDYMPSFEKAGKKPEDPAYEGW